MNKNKKHSFEFKLYCVEQIACSHYSAKSIAKEHGITHSMVERWFKKYEYNGAEGLTPRKKKQIISPSFKLMVLTAIQGENLSLNEAILRFDLSSPALIVDWQKRLEKHGPAGLEPRPKGRPPMASNEKRPIKRKPRKSNKPLTREEELLRELEFLRAENALLKKLQALVQEENKRKP